MPLYEYECADCHQACELLVRSDEDCVCPNCQSRRLVKQLSVPAAPSMGSPSLPMAASGGETCGRPQCQRGCMFGDS